MRTLGKVDKVLDKELALLSDIKNNENPANKSTMKSGGIKNVQTSFNPVVKKSVLQTSSIKIHVNILASVPKHWVRSECKCAKAVPKPPSFSETLIESERLFRFLQLYGRRVIIWFNTLVTL